MIRRVLAAAALLAGAAVLIAFAWPQLLGLQRQYGVAHVVSFRAGAAVIGVALIVLCLMLAAASRRIRRFMGSAAVLLLVFVLVNAAVLSTRGFGATDFAEAVEGDVTVLSWNTLGDAPGAGAIAELALETGADVLTLPETTNALGIEIAGLMREGGSPMWVHTVAFDEISKSRSTTVLTSVDLGIYEEDTTLGNTSVLPTVVLQPEDGEGPTIIGVHAVSPLPAEMANWRTDLDWLGGLCAGGSTIMGGDFNATLDHMSGLGDGAGTALGTCIDAGEASGNGAVGTWPTRLPALVGSPIDHVMATADWAVGGMRVVQDRDDYGSDHRPVLATYSPAS
jgi:endonuclease/exonuclease/phosphatase (EEP) superfamily protein YafD